MRSSAASWWIAPAGTRLPNAAPAKQSASIPGRQAASFGELTIEDAAEVLGVSAATVRREWNLAEPGCTRGSAAGRSRSEGYADAMKTTIDRAGRVAIPAAIRRRLVARPAVPTG
jgi:hypothetical protein